MSAPLLRKLVAPAPMLGLFFICFTLAAVNILPGGQNHLPVSSLFSSR